MKTKHVILGLAALLGIGYVATRKDETIAPAPGKARSILFLGDSNTFYDYSYAHSLQRIYPGYRTKIIAKVGVKTSWMLTELKKELALNKYDIICVLGGSNDIYALDENTTAKKNLSDILSLAKKHGMRTLVISPPNKNFFTRRTDKKQRLLLDLISSLSKKLPKEEFIDFWTITNDKKYFIKDDGYLHAQKPAHDILVKHVIEKLKL